MIKIRPSWNHLSLSWEFLYWQDGICILKKPPIIIGHGKNLSFWKDFFFQIHFYASYQDYIQRKRLGSVLWKSIERSTLVQIMAWCYQATGYYLIDFDKNQQNNCHSILPFHKVSTLLTISSNHTGSSYKIWPALQSNNPPMHFKRLEILTVNKTDVGTPTNPRPP